MRLGCGPASLDVVQLPLRLFVNLLVAAGGEITVDREHEAAADSAKGIEVETHVHTILEGCGFPIRVIRTASTYRVIR